MFCLSAFEKAVASVKADKNKSQIFLEMLPIICSGQCELLDNEKMVAQFGNLLRKTSSGGADKIIKTAGSHDDIANACSGSVVYASKSSSAWVGGIGVFGR